MDSGPPDSRELSLALDLMGYNTDIIEKRRDWYKSFGIKVSHLKTTLPSRLKELTFKVYIVGSRREGISVHFSSDRDFMIVNDFLLCSKHKPQSGDGANKAWLKLISEKENVQPGYALLQPSPDNRPLIKGLFDKVTDQRNGEKFVSSKKLNQLIVGMYKRAYEHFESGYPFPLDSVEEQKEQSEDTKIKLRLKSEYFNDADLIFAFPCDGLDFITKWETRERKYSWPKPATIEKIKQMCTYVVAKGSKISDQRDLEFRICHTMGEIELIKSLNETQLKVYILLKELFKSEEEFDHHYPDIFTSYMLKNVVFWLCETISADCFTVDLLQDRVKDALKYINKCLLDDAVLPNYFIPERNLLADIIKPENIQEIRDILSRWLDEGNGIYGRIQTMKQVMMEIRQSTPQQLEEKIASRSQKEIDDLKTFNLDYEENVMQKATEKIYEYMGNPAVLSEICG